MTKFLAATPQTASSVYLATTPEEQIYKPTYGQVVEASVNEAFEGIGTYKADLASSSVSLAKNRGNALTREDYTNSEFYRPEIGYFTGMTDEQAKELSKYHDSRATDRDILQRSTTGQYSVGLAAGLVAGTIEPKNLMIGMATFGAGRFIAGASGATKLTKVLNARRANSSYAARAQLGALEGLVATAVAEPSNRYSASILQEDYTMADTMFNLATSTVLGAGLEVAPEFIARRFRELGNKSKALDITMQELDTAVDQLSTGRKIEVDAVEKAYTGEISKKPMSEKVAAVEQYVRYTETPEFKARFADKLVMDDAGNVIQTTSKLSDHIEQKYGVQTYLAERKDDLYLASIKTPEDMRGQGFGTSAMNGIVKYADSVGKRIALTPSSDFGGSLPRLKEFYKRFGFIENKGKNKDYSISETFYREPSKTSDFTELQSFVNESAKRIDAERAASLNAHIKSQANPNNDTAIDLEAISRAEDYDEQLKLQEHIDELQKFDAYMDDIAAMKSQGVLNEADEKALLDALNGIDENKLQSAWEAARICLTRG